MRETALQTVRAEGRQVVDQVPEKKFPRRGKSVRSPPWEEEAWQRWVLNSLQPYSMSPCATVGTEYKEFVSEVEPRKKGEVG